MKKVFIKFKKNQGLESLSFVILKNMEITACNRYNSKYND